MWPAHNGSVEIYTFQWKQKRLWWQLVFLPTGANIGSFQIECRGRVVFISLVVLASTVGPTCSILVSKVFFCSSLLRYSDVDKSWANPLNDEILLSAGHDTFSVKWNKAWVSCSTEKPLVIVQTPCVKSSSSPTLGVQMFFGYNSQKS